MAQALTTWSPPMSDAQIGLIVLLVIFPTMGAFYTFLLFKQMHPITFFLAIVAILILLI
jgi:hypothetical protein